MSYKWETKFKPLDRVKHVSGDTGTIIQIEIQRYELEKEERYCISYSVFFDHLHSSDPNKTCSCVEDGLSLIG